MRKLTFESTVESFGTPSYWSNPMHKLKLESLQVESFETAALAVRLRGTVEAHSGPEPTPTTIGPQTYDVEVCGETQYFDCSLGCPSIAPCDLTDSVDCA
jgi:hypothetical protein